MDISEDDDIFMLSGDLATDVASSSNVSLTERDNDSNSRNPVKEHLLKQLNEVQERVERKRREIEETKSLKEKIMRKFTYRHLFGENFSSDSESELFTASGEPIVKRKRMRYFKRTRKEPLVVKGNWQHVTDDKWIVGVVLQNTIEEDLYELDLNVRIKDLDNLTGLSSFWTRDSRSFWRRTDLAAGTSGSSGEVAATVVLDLPKFTISNMTKIFGTVSYEFEDQRNLQTLIPAIELNIENILNGDYEIKFVTNENHSDNPSALDSTVQAILSAKSLAIEKITEFKLSKPLKNDDVKNNFGIIGLREILPKVFTFDNSTLDRLSIVELTYSNSSTITKFKTIIYARSVQRLNILLNMLHSVFPNGTSVACKNVTSDDVIKAFETELNLYLNTENNFDIQKAVVNSDFISNEFENGFTIYRA